MFAYELQRERQNDLQHQADEWRLVRAAKAARAAERRSRRTHTRTAARADPEESPALHRTATRVRRAPHPHSTS
jgi:hypothetical protein